ncbi:hypothetical protein [Methyloprofundus sp.]|uniref:hypothetical protein n=1 Tax=Methyloprofundus sp. TaxID=2020875 RepID=UPI003D0FC792
MDSILNQTAVIIAIACAGLFFMTALITGCWKFYCMLHSEQFQAPYYVDIAHRASLLYSFAAILIAVFAFFSPFAVWVSVIATIAPLLFFAIAIFHYIKLGIHNTTDNQLRDSEDPGADKIIMLSLMTAEIGGFLVLLIGFFIQVF